MVAKTDLNKIIIIHVNPTKSRYILCQAIYVKLKDTQRLKKDEKKFRKLLTEETWCSYINSR